MKKIGVLSFIILLLSAVCVYAAQPCYVYHAMFDEGSENKEYANIKSSDKMTQDISGVTDTVTVTDKDGKQSLPEESTTALGAEASYIKNAQKAVLPLAYGFPVNIYSGFNEYLNFDVKVPYLKRELGDKSESGLGDVKLLSSYLAQSEKMIFNTVFSVKFDTGEVENCDVPLGTGATDFGLATNFTFFFNKFTLNFGAGYILTGKYSDLDYGDEYMVTTGGKYYISDNLSAGTDFTYNVHEEDDYGGSPAPGIDTMDIVPSLTYLMERIGSTVKFSAVVPVSTSYNGEDFGLDDPERDFEIKVKFNQPF